MFFAAGNDVSNNYLIRRNLLRLEIDVYIEIPAALKVIAQICDAANQQIAIHGIFIVDRNVSFQLALGYICPFGSNGYPGPGIGPDRWPYTVSCGVEFSL